MSNPGNQRPSGMPCHRYQPFRPVDLPDRQWPDRVLTHAPRWCSVDLRDGNQALAVPMNVSQKLELFQTLVKTGFKEIEVGFPSASNTEFTFNRRLIEEKRVPDDVWLQVLVQAREDLIERTVESLVGAKKVIIHMYNSTSPAQRRVVFGKSKDEIKAILTKAFAFLHQTVQDTSDADLEKTHNFFGNTINERSLFMIIYGHCWEHLGQSIAYARMNGVVPPWSKPGNKD